MDNRVAIISIIVEDNSVVNTLNALLHEYGEYIIGRLGIPYREKSINIICVAIDAPEDRINTLCGKIGKLAGVNAKINYSNVVTECGTE